MGCGRALNIKNILLEALLWTNFIIYKIDLIELRELLYNFIKLQRKSKSQVGSQVQSRSGLSCLGPQPTCLSQIDLHFVLLLPSNFSISILPFFINW